MRRSFFLLFLSALVFLLVNTSLISGVQGQSGVNYSLDIQGLAWNRTTLNIMVVTPNNESWWNPIYLNSTLRAIGQWNEAITYFASNYTQYSYISSVKMQTTVSNVALSGFDIYLNYTQFPLANTSNEIGLETWTSQANEILNSNISLATHTSHGDSLTDGDMQNVALHELGHSLGLGHCNYTGDTMYPAYTLLSPPRLISTLDVYGVATVFAWLQYSITFAPVNAWLQAGPVMLPPDIPYENLPVSPQYALPQTLANNPVVQTLNLLFELLIHPEILAIIVVLIITFTVIAIYPTKKQSPKADS